MKNFYILFSFLILNSFNTVQAYNFAADRGYDPRLIELLAYHGDDKNTFEIQVGMSSSYVVKVDNMNTANEAKDKASKILQDCLRNNKKVDIVCDSNLSHCDLVPLNLIAWDEKIKYKSFHELDPRGILIVEKYNRLELWFKSDPIFIEHNKYQMSVKEKAYQLKSVQLNALKYESFLELQLDETKTWMWLNIIDSQLPKDPNRNFLQYDLDLDNKSEPKNILILYKGVKHFSEEFSSSDKAFTKALILLDQLIKAYVFNAQIEFKKIDEKWPWIELLETPLNEKTLVEKPN